jgi:type IV fimbrial biogenesis protein FimT
VLRVFPLPKQNARPFKLRGFSVIELMTAVALAAILLTLAIPSFTSFLNSNRVTSQANELLTTFQLARMEAIRRNGRVVVCSSSDGTTCAAGTAWSGWITYVDIAGDGFTATDPVIQKNALSAPTSGTANAAVGNEVVFRSDGFARTSTGALLDGIVGICVPTTSPLENARDVNIAAGSRMAVTKRNATSACTGP